MRSLERWGECRRWLAEVPGVVHINGDGGDFERARNSEGERLYGVQIKMESLLVCGCTAVEVDDCF